jgi:hypothetical protein
MSVILDNLGGNAMSDFLRNLRSSHKKDSSNSRHNLDGHYYPPKERRRMPDRRSGSSSELDMLWSCLNETLPRFVDNTIDLTCALEKKVEEESRLTEAKIRQHTAISLFFDNLNKLFSSELEAGSPGGRPHATTSYASGTHYTKDDILTMIREMRKDGATFAIIADFLKDKGIPTFSGRGEWHAQTIHRLCK